MPRHSTLMRWCSFDWPQVIRVSTLRSLLGLEQVESQKHEQIAVVCRIGLT